MYISFLHQVVEFRSYAMNRLSQLSVEQSVKYEVIMLGNSAVGKSSLLRRYLMDVAPSTSQISPTIGAEFKAKTINLLNLFVKLKIWDTSGQKRFSHLLGLYYKHCIGAIVVYDIQCRNSFEEAMDWVVKLREEVSQRLVIVFVGNKADMEANRVITKNEGKAFAELHKLIFMEVSSESGMNVQNCFMELAKAIQAQFDEKPLKIDEKTPCEKRRCWQLFKPSSMKDME